ncbi:MAG: homocysteine S-methyltransferase family protein [Bacillota bacterium]
MIERVIEVSRSRPVLMDGAMGTMLVGLVRPGEPVELANLELPEHVCTVHRLYLRAGAKVLLANTFGANPLKLSLTGHEGKTRALNVAAVQLARRACQEEGRSDVTVLASMGPTGQLMSPVGPICFDAAYEAYREQARALAESGADGVLVETMSDLLEAKAAVLACRDEGLPVACTMTFEGGSTTMGVSPECAAITLESLGALAVGANCSTGPDQLAAVIARMRRMSRVPLIARPNAGVPGKNEWKDPQAWWTATAKLVEFGASLIGGCCGSTPEHIRGLGESLAKRMDIEAREQAQSTTGEALQICGSGRAARLELLGSPVIVGERINPARKRALRQDMVSKKFELVMTEARQQVKCGAVALDLAADIPGQDHASLMRSLVHAVQGVWDGPCFIDSSHLQALEAGLKEFRGRPVLNSLRLEEPLFSVGARLAKRFGAAVVVLPSTTQGVPDSVEGRLSLVRDMLSKLEGVGVPRQLVLVDPAVTPLSTDPFAAEKCLGCIKELHRQGLLTCAGISNISHGLPSRPVLNGAFLTAACSAGLDAPIADPCSPEIQQALVTGALLAARDPGCQGYIKAMAAPVDRSQEASDPMGRLRQAVLDGNGEAAVQWVMGALEAGLSPIEVLESGVTRAMEEAGRLFEQRVFFIPNLLLAAEAAKKCLEVLRPRLGTSLRKRARVAMATVEGDIHDVGKNIVCAVLESRGFQVVDLGKSVPIAAIVDAASSADVVGLSSLMTTTLPAMERTVRAVKARWPNKKVIVGGGVLTQEYAVSIGADGYAKDAAGAAELVLSITGGSKQGLEEGE